MSAIGEVVIGSLTTGIGLILFWMVRGGFRDVDRRFEQVDRRFERLEQRMDDRFAMLEGRIHEVRADITGLAIRLIGPDQAEGGS